mmetsp:Transcript_1348/g.4394  ORF Transcript_1348/g.4394 Transcript_1348/m.4394 type:complete len:246 (+) Transcript_1348:517-1254(+)
MRCFHRGRQRGACARARVLRARLAEGDDHCALKDGTRVHSVRGATLGVRYRIGHGLFAQVHPADHPPRPQAGQHHAVRAEPHRKGRGLWPRVSRNLQAQGRGAFALDQGGALCVVHKPRSDGRRRRWRVGRCKGRAAHRRRGLAALHGARKLPRRGVHAHGRPILLCSDHVRAAHARARLRGHVPQRREHRRGRGLGARAPAARACRVARGGDAPAGRVLARRPRPASSVQRGCDSHRRDARRQR